MSFAKTASRWKTIGARLTLWGAAVTLFVCGSLCAVLYAGVFFSLRQGIDAFLEGEVREFMLTVNEHSNDDSTLEQVIRRELGARTRHDLAFRLFDTKGRIFVSSEADDSFAKIWSAPQGWYDQTHRPLFQTINPPGDPYPYRTCSLLVTTPDGRRCTAQASYLLDRMTASLARFRKICVIVLAVAAAIALFVGRFLAYRSLKPIQALTAAANLIGAANLGERVPLAGTDDELDRLAGTLNEMLTRIDQYVEQLRQFTADASHELRTPLAALRGSAELALSRTRSAEELRLVIEDSLERYDRLQRIAEDLLLLARLDAGENILHIERVQLDRAVEDIVDLYRPVAEDRGLELRQENAEAIWINGDGGRVRQLIGNLIDNAVKYTPSPGRVTVSLSRENGVARLVVADTGRGIDPEDLPRVFDRFYRVDRSRSTSRADGTGLGLSICRSIAEAHHGSIELQSTPARGTQATVTLPIG
jgi:heavy metal sensor kinase